MSTKSESGLRRHRVEFAREDVTADGELVTPTDPSWNFYSDVVRSVEATLGPNIEEQRGIGSPDVQNFFHGPEEHEMTITYDLQQWFTDGSGNALDAAYDGLIRDVDGLLPNTHTVVDREWKTEVAANNTVAGTQPRDTRLYTVMRGSYVDEVTLTGDPGDQQPVAIELSYMGEIMRPFQIDQPAESGETLSIVSTSPEDTTQSVTLETEDGSVTESLTLDGTTEVPTTSPYPDLDVVSLSAEAVGDVMVLDSAGEELCIIHGLTSYDDIRGDLGIPATGTGSHASPIDQPYELFIGDTIHRGGSPMAMNINSYEMTVSNNCEPMVRNDTFRQRIHPGDRESEVSATTAGEKESHQRWMNALLTEEADIDWNLTGGTITAPGAALTEPGSRTYETGQAAMTLDNTFTGKGAEVTAN